MNPKKGGWQTNVEYFSDYVIKTPKTIEEISEKVSKNLVSKGKLHQLEEYVERIQKDWDFSIKLIKNSSIPLEHLAYPEFLEEGKIKQRKAEMFLEKIISLVKKNDLASVEKMAEKFCEFVWLLWSYGFNEKTFKVLSEFGILDGKIVLIDFGELTDEKEKVAKYICEKKWYGLRYIGKYSGKEVEKIFKTKVEKMITIKKLDEHWGKSK